MARGIVSEGPKSDADRQIKAAARIQEWRWISDMHLYTQEKARLKDVGVLLLVLMQRLFRDRRGFYPVVAVSALANTLAAILVYFVAAVYWTPFVGFTLFILYLFCLWPYQIVLQGGYHVVAMAVFLLAIHFYQIASQLLFPYNLIYFFLGGAVSALMMFSSASARKFMPLLAAGFIFSLRSVIVVPQAQALVHALVQGWGAVFLMGLMFFSGGRFILRLLSHRFVAELYQGHRWPQFSSALIRKKDLFSLSHYQTRSNEYLDVAADMLSLVMAYALACHVFAATREFYSIQATTLLGFGFIVWLFIRPRYIENMKGLFGYWTITRTCGHFRSYIDYFARRGMVIEPTMRPGLLWYPALFWRMTPFHCVGILVSGLMVLLLAFSHGTLMAEVSRAAVVLLVGFSPLIYSEFSYAVQVARTYFPAFAGELFLFGYFYWRTVIQMPTAGVPLMVASGIFLITFGVWNIWAYWTDLWPARMAGAWVLRTLHALKVKEIFTYDTPYNTILLNALRGNEEQTPIKIHWIKGLSDVDKGYVLIPGTSAKALNMESESYAIDHGDFREDPFLNQLLDSNEIQRYAIARFKTVGCSLWWAQDGEVPTYLDLILHEISDQDRWRGWAWIVDASRFSHQKAATEPIMSGEITA